MTTSNQTPPRVNGNALPGDGALITLLRSFENLPEKGLLEQGAWVNTAEAMDLARLSNEHPPILRTHDAAGERLNRVEFHPAYHALMRRGVGQGLSGSVWQDGAGDGAHRHFLRGVRFMLTAQLECGHLCPLTMTNAAGAIFAAQPDLGADWMPRLTSRTYDSSHKAPGEKSGLTFGMGMTERQGGTDVRSNRTRAQPIKDGKSEGLYRIDGEKWFFSAPMSDAFFILAQANQGLSCFLIPRLLPDGRQNGLNFRRLKNKLGNQANASSEVEIVDALGTLVGEEGQGIRTILDMVTMTRLDCALGSAGQMRAALADAVHHARHRSVFDRKLIDQPLMQRVLADMALDVAAAQLLSLRLARSFDRAAESEEEAGYARLMTPVVKYWVCKIAPPLITEALECLGGNGYVEDHPMARLYREAPLNSVWEGSGNVMCLDVLRVMRKGPKTVDAVLQTIAETMGGNSGQAIDVLRVASDMALNDEGSARLLTEQLAISAAAGELRRVLPGAIADAFVETRLGRPWRNTYGMLDARTDCAAILDFLCPG